NLHLLKTLLHALARGRVSGDLRREGRGLARALETRAARRLPCDDVALAVGERDDRVVEARLDVRDTHGDVLAHTATAAASANWALLSHRLLLHFLAAGNGHPLGTLARAGVRLGALAADRETTAVAEAA